MKKINYSILTVVIILALCCAMLAGCGQKVSQLAEAGNPAAGAANDAAVSVEADAISSATAEYANATSPDTDAGTAAGDIGVDEAKSIALRHAEVVTADVTFARTEKDYDDGRLVYEVEFYSGSKEYDYEIDASTGAIVSYDHDAEYYTKPAAVPDSGTATDIGVEEAKSIALKHAGVTAADVTFARTEKDYDDGRLVYEVEFYSGSKEYDYEIDASTGAVVSYDHDAEYYTKPTSKPDAGTSTGNITVEEAKSIALKHAGVTAAEVTFARTEKDYDGGRLVYEVEFYSGSKEYDYEIDASTGAVVSYDHDAEYYTKPTASAGNSSNYIGIEKAKSIALKHAGLSAGSVSFSKAKFEDDDGRKEYEIEFYCNGTEYEYTIDASGGKIVEYDSERDD